ncbi:histidine phosphatase family protein [Cnuibacter physcomitrellae]|uniref:histidine phosphatase family protein n=1 Tax=Cnuibacter physcomitrellae TaxID=1619308 RepID=UPI002175E3E5|nr:histidine phosphatase family protein [Cnuibacter physcomitrellae]MCS5498220.1 histidine phosphatase family protein [Cnuibacter physcomitrellae]
MTSDGTLRVHLVRHAETLFNLRHLVQGWCDSPLTPRGHRQAAALGRHFAEVPLVAAYSSDLGRARATTSGALAAHSDLDPVCLPELREWDFGGWEGRVGTDLWQPAFAAGGYDHRDREHWRELTGDGAAAMIDLIADSDPSGLAERSASVRARMSAAVATITRAVPEGDVLVMTHGAVLHSLVPALLPGARVPGTFPNGGLVTITRARSGWSIGEVDSGCALFDDVEEIVLP